MLPQKKRGRPEAGQLAVLPERKRGRPEGAVVPKRPEESALVPKPQPDWTRKELAARKRRGEANYSGPEAKRQKELVEDLEKRMVEAQKASRGSALWLL